MVFFAGFCAAALLSPPLVPVEPPGYSPRVPPTPGMVLPVSPPRLEPTAAMLLPVAGVGGSPQIQRAGLVMPATAVNRTADDYLLSADAHARRLDLVSAALDADTARRLAPASAHAWMISAEIAERQGLRPSAREFAEYALSLDPTCGGAHRLRAAFAYEREDYDSALAHATEAVRFAPGDHRGWAGRAAVRMVRGERAAAYRDYTAAIRAAPTCGEHYALRADASLGLGDIADADLDTEIAVQLDPANPRCHLVRSAVNFACGRWDDYVASVNRALIRPNRFGISQGIWKEYDGRFQAEVIWMATLRALPTYDEAGLGRQFAQMLEFDPKSAVALAARGALADGMGKPAEGRRDIERAIELDPNYAFAHMALGRILGAAGDPRAGESLQTAACLAPGDANNLRYLGYWESRNGRPREALAHYREAVDLAPADGPIRMGYAAACHANGRTEEAIRQATIAAFSCANDAARADALLLRARFRLAQGEVTTALADLCKSDRILDRLRKPAEAAQQAGR